MLRSILAINAGMICLFSMSHLSFAQGVLVLPTNPAAQASIVADAAADTPPCAQDVKMIADGGNVVEIWVQPDAAIVEDSSMSPFSCDIALEMNFAEGFRTADIEMAHSFKLPETITDGEFPPLLRVSLGMQVFNASSQLVTERIYQKWHDAPAHPTLVRHDILTRFPIDATNTVHFNVSMDDEGVEWVPPVRSGEPSLDGWVLLGRMLLN